MAFTNSQGRTQSSLSEINITPFVDVVLVLLIIFMLTAPILETGIQLDLPKTRTVKVVSKEKVVITIDRDENYYVGNDMVNFHRLGDTVLGILKKTKNAPVFIRSDENAPFGAFARVVDELKQSGITNLNIDTERLETKHGGGQ
jgi:biopolymer transport protein TolR